MSIRLLSEFRGCAAAVKRGFKDARISQSLQQDPARLPWAQMATRIGIGSKLEVGPTDNHAPPAFSRFTSPNYPEIY
jgi:hypothetical protein